VGANGVRVQSQRLGELIGRERPLGCAQDVEQAGTTRVRERPMTPCFHVHGESFDDGEDPSHPENPAPQIGAGTDAGGWLFFQYLPCKQLDGGKLR
jgi:hypothetical protein